MVKDDVTAAQDGHEAVMQVINFCLLQIFLLTTNAG
jgi:hypothetical protein